MNDAPAWAKGYPVDDLRERALIFKEAFARFNWGAFVRPKEAQIAEALAAGECVWTRDGRNSVQAVALAKTLKAPGQQTDFSGRVLRPSRGDIYIRAIAGTPSARQRVALSIIDRGAPAVWLEDFPEAGQSDTWRALGFDHVATKVIASSEVKAIWHRGDRSGGRLPIALHPSENVALAVLAADWLGDPGPYLAELDAYAAKAGAEPWAQHYSTYNRRHSWTAFALRGYDRDDPGFIIKPAEMARSWKEENPHRLGAICAETIAAPHFPLAMAAVARLPGKPQRIRLMRLAGGNGELSRHADITDPDCGLDSGKVARLHIPLQSPASCRFIGWDTMGQRIERRFPPGALCYLDTRKPHSVINPGDHDRIHLVVDQASTPELRALIASAAKA